MNEFRTKLPLFVFLGMLLLGALYYSTVYVPMQKDIAAMRAESEALERQSRFYDLYVQEIDALRGRVDGLRREMNDYRSEDFRVHGKTLLEELRGSFEQTGVIPSNIIVGSPSVLTVDEGMRVLSLPFSVEVFGGYEQFAAFLQFFENAEHTYFRVVSVEMADLLRSSVASVDFVLVYPEKGG